MRSDLKKAHMPPGFVDAAHLIPDLAIDIRYAGSDNFVGRPIDGYGAPRCLLTRQAAEALAAVQRDLAAEGLGLKVFDGYRPARAVAHFVRWSKDAHDTVEKAAFYPEIDKSDLFDLGFLSLRSSHSRGSAVDLTLLARDTRRELPMGGAFDFFGEQSFFAYTNLAPDARVNRDRLREAMTRRGFNGYDKEWWHFVLRDEPYPDTIFDCPITP